MSHLTDVCFYEGEVKKLFFERIGVTVKKKSDNSLTVLGEHLGLTQIDVAKSFDVSSRTVQNWERHGQVSERRYRDLKELSDLLTKYIDCGDVPTWMETLQVKPSGNARRVN